MKKMYTNKPIVEFDEPEVQLAQPDDAQEKRIKQLESKVNQLAEQMNRLVEALEVTRRGMRRQGTDISNISTVLRNR